MSDSDPPSEYTRIRDFIARIEKNVLPARQYLQASYENYPLTTTVMVVSAALSFAPIVVVLHVFCSPAIFPFSHSTS
ncbi:hypothetical protein GGX14DRAFT_572661 [Mycena pura]|uniref:Uncharacterized protein n=1 Tax=Mycena pura TaxID=153505 RepID=A0AAD6Y3L9_9AGAR|nr:hypothetical protein GGX14DRAFT_572661 [Mycena pura]